MDVFEVAPSLGNWLVADFTVVDFDVGKITFKDPVVGSLGCIGRPLPLDLKFIVQLDEFDQIQVGLGYKHLKEYRKAFVLVGEFQRQAWKLAAFHLWGRLSRWLFKQLTSDLEFDHLLVVDAVVVEP